MRPNSAGHFSASSRASATCPTSPPTPRSLPPSPPAKGESLESMMRDFETKIVPGAGHLLFDESREAVDAAADFVSRPFH